MTLGISPFSCFALLTLPRRLSLGKSRDFSGWPPCHPFFSLSLSLLGPGAGGWGGEPNSGGVESLSSCWRLDGDGERADLILALPTAGSFRRPRPSLDGSAGIPRKTHTGVGCISETQACFLVLAALYYYCCCCCYLTPSSLQSTFSYLIIFTPLSRQLCEVILLSPFHK